MGGCSTPGMPSFGRTIQGALKPLGLGAGEFKEPLCCGLVWLRHARLGKRRGKDLGWAPISVGTRTGG